MLHSFYPIFNEKAKILIRELNKLSGPEHFDCFNQISACTLETLLFSMFGIDRDVQSDASNSKYLNDIVHGTKAMNDRLFKVWFHFEPLFKISKGYNSYKKYVINGIFAIAGEILKEKAEQEVKESSSKHKIFIDQLLQAKQTLTEDEIIDEINTLIGAVSLIKTSLS